MNGIERFKHNETGAEVSAIVLSEANLEEASYWCDGVIVDGLIPGSIWLGVKTPEGLYYTNFGDYILQYRKKKYRSMKAEVFEKQYTKIG